MSEAPKRLWISPPSVLSQSERVRFAYEAPNDEVELVYVSAAALRELCDLLQVRACFFRSTSPENPVDAFRASEIETVVFELEKLLKGE